MQEDLLKTAAATRLVVCEHSGFPLACHDQLIQPGDQGEQVAFCHQFAPQKTANSSCRLLPQLVTAGMQQGVGLPSLRWEFGLRVCNAWSNARSIGDALELDWTSVELPQHHTLHLVMYDVCSTKYGSYKRLVHSSSVLAEHVIASVYAERSGHGTADVMVLLADSWGFGTGRAGFHHKDLRRMLAVAARKAVGHSLSGNFHTGLWLIGASSKEPSQSAHVCETYMATLAMACPVPHNARWAATRAIAFSSKLLLNITLSIWEAAVYTAALEASSQMLFDLLYVLLMKAATDMGAHILPFTVASDGDEQLGETSFSVEAAAH